MADSLFDWLALLLAKGMGLKGKLKLLQLAAPSVLRQWAIAGDLTGVSTRIQQQLATPDKRAIQQCLDWCESADDRHLVTLTDERYPFALKQITDPPLVLFVEGHLHTLSGPGLAVVGSRRASVTTKELTAEWSRQLAAEGWVIVSGLAEGVDACAHRGALEAGLTVAVTGCGLAQCYPKRHYELSQQIRTKGALVSPFPPWEKPKRAYFPQRNRIVSGLSYGTVVMEAGLKSGSLITARLASEQGREVFAVPGSVAHPEAAGCHFLIQQGAKLVTEPVHISEELLPMGQPQAIEAAAVETELPLPKLLDSVGYEATAVDVVVARSDLPVEEVLEQLLMLELEGRVAQVPGGYVRLRGG